MRNPYDHWDGADPQMMEDQDNLLMRNPYDHYRRRRRRRERPFVAMAKGGRTWMDCPTVGGRCGSGGRPCAMYRPHVSIQLFRVAFGCLPRYMT